MLVWAAVAATWVCCSFVVFFVASLVDEDVNHWSWTGNGPAPSRTVALIAAALAVGAIPTGLLLVTIRLLT